MPTPVRRYTTETGFDVLNDGVVFAMPVQPERRRPNEAIACAAWAP
jgi:hypothetical protein